MIHYKEYGNKFNPTIMFLHGEDYVYTFARQRELMKNYHLVVPHIPGFGEAVKEEFNAEKAIEQLIELAESLGMPCTLIGFSLGAQLCLPLICKRPDLFNGVIMISPWLIKNMQDIEKMLRRISDNEGKMKNPLSINVSAIALGLTGEDKKLHTEYCMEQNVNNLAAAADNGIDIEKYPEYSQLEMPILALCGLKEEMEIRNSVRALCKNNPNCSYDMWDGAGHNLPYKCAARLNKVIDEFMEKVRHFK